VSLYLKKVRNLGLGFWEGIYRELSVVGRFRRPTGELFYIALFEAHRYPSSLLGPEDGSVWPMALSIHTTLQPTIIVLNFYFFIFF
jgi:hypothetical protein